MRICHSRPYLTTAVESPGRRPNRFDADPSSLTRARAPGWSNRITRQAAIGAEAASHTALAIRTAEGDQITISLAARAELSAQYKETGQSQSLRAGASVSTQLRVSLNGDLSEAELADVNRLIESLGQARAQAETGAGAASVADAAAGLATIAAFQYSHRETATAGVLLRVAA